MANFVGRGVYIRKMSYENTLPKRFSKLSQHTNAEIARELIKENHKNLCEAARHFIEKYKTKYPQGNGSKGKFRDMPKKIP